MPTPTPAPPSPMGNPLFLGAMPLPVPGHTPCLVTTMATGEAIVTPMAPSPSPLGNLPPMLPGLPLLMPNGLGMGFTGEMIPDMLPELTLNRSKSVPQGAGMGLKINVMQDSIQAPSLDPLPVYNGGGLGHRSSRSRSRDRADVDAPLPTGPGRSHSRERREPSRERELMQLKKIDS